MANRTLELDAPQGLTLTAELYTPGADAVVATITLTERTNDKGCYTGTISGITGGLYRIRVKSGTTTIARGLLRHTDATGVERPDDVDAILSATHGTGQWDAVGSGGSGSGTGAYTVTITVNDGSAALQNASIRLIEGANQFTATTNVSGVATFSLDAATYSVAITKTGYTFTPTTLVVSGATSHTYSMTANTVTAPSVPGNSVLTGLVLGNDGLPESDVIVSFKMTAGPGDDGYILSTQTRTATSDANGEIELDGFVIGATYDGWRGTGTRVSKVIPSASSFEWPELLGSP